MEQHKTIKRKLSLQIYCYFSKFTATFVANVISLGTLVKIFHPWVSGKKGSIQLITWDLFIHGREDNFFKQLRGSSEVTRNL